MLITIVNSLITKKLQNIISDNAKKHTVAIAAISLWETSMLVRKKCITLDKPVLVWIEEALQLPGMALMPLTPAIAVESTHLPENFHGDPADRLIVATARVHGLTLMTQDEKILAYGKKDFLSVISIKQSS